VKWNKPIRKISKKRAEQLRTYARLKKMMLRGAMCEVCKKKVATDIHHQCGRAGRMLNNVRYWMGVCRKCYQTIHENPAWAKARGYLVSRIGAAVPPVDLWGVQ